MLGDCWSRTPQLQKKLLKLAERENLAEREKFSGKRTGQSYDGVARSQLESRAGNHDFWDRKVKKATVPERPREESSTTALKAAAEDRRAQRPS